MAKSKRVADPEISENGLIEDSELKAAKKEQPNDDLDLSGFDYANLTGEKFEEYSNLVNSLDATQLFDFVLMKASPLFVERYPGLPNTPKDFKGIKTKEDRPEHTTRITVAHANDYNMQIFNDAAKRNGKYYLLKK